MVNKNKIDFYSYYYPKSIKMLINDSREVLTAPFDIKREAVLYFQRFLQTEQHSGVNTSVEALQDLLSYRCPTIQAGSLQAPVSASEIILALNFLPNDKVSGPDECTKEFYIAAWLVIGKDFVTAVQSFFIYGFMPKGVNSTILALIPKKENAHTTKDYQPIAYCNIQNPSKSTKSNPARSYRTESECIYQRSAAS